MTKNNGFPVERALISVSDKAGLAEFARRLELLGIEIVSTGGTATYLRDSGIPVRPVSEITNFPEILEGRVKTLHPAIHGAILANLDLSSTRAALAAHGMVPIGLVVINLYPFEQAAKQHASDIGMMVEKIDIGGAALLRGAAKNHAFVTAVSDPSDYGLVLEELARNGRRTTLKTRRSLAAKAFARVAAYDSAIAAWFASTSGETETESFSITGKLRQKLRYGENPHQSAALYEVQDRTGPSIVAAEQVQGKELSYNNIVDADAALELISEFQEERPSIAIIKHANPCGVATGETLADAYRKAVACDTVSAFGGIVASNRILDEETAKEILRIFTEVVIAPSATPEAKQVFSTKPNTRLLLTGSLLPLGKRSPSFRSVSGGFLVQDADLGSVDDQTLRTVTKREPTPQEHSDMIFAMKIAKHVRSNAIVFAKGGATLGIGAGQMSRVDSVRLAVWKATNAATAAEKDAHAALSASAVASDAFFPFPDGVIAAADAGATAIIQPGGSLRDEAVIAAADERGLAMVLTGVRHFRH
ncbi:MAG TPA: bifunctional phosphoribosylaminoimidazolecarboxamide formyltransferase/IMP cyclohydrolase [Hyphomicrobiales bacterium]|nr:bifunctional phosphoribosylaminoimidazolecarboxamide formyltransferase/IMP cyclohydrolase [Hyphomicrobiales bacterium]